MAQGSVRSFQAFWMGGASGGHGIPPPPPPTVTHGAGQSPTRRIIDRKRKEVLPDYAGVLDDLWQEKLLREDEELITILTNV